MARNLKQDPAGDKAPLGPIAPKPVEEYSAHPLALLFPALDEDAFAGLCADIDKNGLIHPIVVLNDQILDGVHRYLACLKTGVAPMIHKFTGSNPAAYVLSANLHRRHLNLTTVQKRQLIGQVLKESPELSDRQVGKITKTDGKTVASERAELESRAEIRTSKTRTDTKGRKSPAKKPRTGGIRTTGPLPTPNDADLCAEHTVDLSQGQPKANGAAGEPKSAMAAEPLAPQPEQALEPETKPKKTPAILDAVDRLVEAFGSIKFADAVGALTTDERRILVAQVSTARRWLNQLQAVLVSPGAAS